MGLDKFGERRLEEFGGRRISALTQHPQLVIIEPVEVGTLELGPAASQRGDLVVTKDGERVLPWVLSEALPKILQAAGIYRPGLGVHALRHTYCSHLAQGGAPAKAIQLLAGHRSERTTDRYLHLSPLHVSQAVACLPEI